MKGQAVLPAISLAFIVSGPVDTLHVVIQTDAGEIEVQLYPAKASVTVANFLRYVDGKPPIRILKVVRKPEMLDEGLCSTRG